MLKIVMLVLAAICFGCGFVGVKAPLNWIAGGLMFATISLLV